MFGDESSQIAVNLLKKALRSEQDFEVKREVRERLELLEPKQVATAKCVVCGCVFEPKKYRYKRYVQRVCQECRNKNSSSQ